jgi:hypothetical protein
LEEYQGLCQNPMIHGVTVLFVAPTPSLLDRFGASLCLPDPPATTEHAGSGDVMRGALEALFFDNRVDMVITGT